MSGRRLELPMPPNRGAAALIEERRRQAVEYKKYLQELADIAKLVVSPETSTSYPSGIDTGAKRALFDNLDENEPLAIKVDMAIRQAKEDSWRGNKMKERKVKNAIRREIGEQSALVDTIFDLAMNQNDY